MQSLESAVDCAGAKHFTRFDRSSQTINVQARNIADFEKVADKPAGSRRDNDGVGRRDPAQAGRPLESLAHESALVGDVTADQVVDDHWPSGDAKTHAQFFSPGTYAWDIAGYRKTLSRSCDI